MLYADIILDISAKALDRPFQYALNEDLQNTVEVGTKVIIPFGRGNREVEGYVINITHTPVMAREKIKFVKSIVKESIPAEGRLLKLAGWLRRTTGSTINEAIKTVLPVKMAVREKDVRLLSLSCGKEKLEDARKNAEKRGYREQLRTIEALQDFFFIEKESPDQTDLDQFIKKYDLSRQTINSLEKKGVIKTRSVRKYRDPYENAGEDESPPEPEMNECQKSVVSEINALYKAGDRKPVLIHAVTGSGKTLIYINLIRNVISEGKKVIVLIPEISLTYQTVSRFRRAFGDRCAVMHSKLSPGERYDQFQKAKKGSIDIMIGPRSALFTPFSDIGMIVIDEEHEPGYQNEYPPKYNGVDVAEYICREENAMLVLGSATPSVNTFYRVQQGKYRCFTINKRAVSNSRLPDVHIEDMRKELKKHNLSVFSEGLDRLIRDRLEKHQQIMLFINRRGYSGAVSCRECGEPVKCPHCSVTLKAHREKGRVMKLMCHYCGYEIPMPDRCPSCGSKYISFLGIGTQKVVDMACSRYPEARILRMDADTTKRKDSHREILRRFSNGEADILVGTQMIVKGHDFPNVTLVGILAADMSLNSDDITAEERTFQLIVQAAGRAGRGSTPGDVVIQTYQPDNYAVKYAAAGDYYSFYRQEIANRTILQYPPVSHILEMQVRSADEKKCRQCAGVIAESIKKHKSKKNVLGPAEAGIYKLRDEYRMMIYIKTGDEDLLYRFRYAAQKYVLETESYRGVTVTFKTL